MKNFAERGIFHSVVLEYLHTNEYRAWLRRTIEITCVAELAAVEVFLECVEHVLYAAVKLEIKMMT